MCGANHGGGEANDGWHRWLDQWLVMSGMMVYLWERGPQSERDEELSRETATIVKGGGGEICVRILENFLPLFNGETFYTTFLWVFLWLEIFYRWLTMLLWNKHSKIYKIFFWKYFSSQPSECKCIFLLFNKIKFLKRVVNVFFKNNNNNKKKEKSVVKIGQMAW